MKTIRFFVLVLVLALLTTLGGAVGAQEPQPTGGEGLSVSTLLSMGCVAGGVYDPACDVNHDGKINIIDIQLAASHWGQTGTWTSNSWSLTGNAGTNPSTNFLGTTDSQPLVLKTNGAERMRIDATGNVSIGTAGSIFTLDVNGTGRITDSFVSKKISGVRYCDQFSGADAGEKIVNCMANLPSTGGIADARGIQGAQIISSTVTIPIRVTLLLGNATFTASASIQLSYGSRLIGTGIGNPPSYGQTTIKQAAGTNIDLIVNDPSISYTSFLHWSEVSNLQLRGNSSNSGGSGIVMNTRTGEGFKLEHLIIVDFPDSGIRILRGAVPLYMEDIHVFRSGKYGIDIYRTSGDINQLVKLSLISGDNNGKALIRIKTSGGINLPETYLIEGVKAEKSIGNGKQNDVIVLDTLNGSPVIINGLSAYNGSNEAANSLVKIIGTSARVYWSGFASTGNNKFNYWINDTVYGINVPANHSSYVTGATGGVSFNTFLVGLGETPAFVVNSAGNVGIGTTGPSSTLHITHGEVGSVDAKGIRIENTVANAGAGQTYLIDSGVQGVNNAYFGVKDVTNNAYRFVIKNNGNVGIGTTSSAAGYKLDVEGKIQAIAFDVGDITFRDQKTQQILWRMFEDDDGLYLENAKTGKVYRFVLQEVDKAGERGRP